MLEEESPLVKVELLFHLYIPRFHKGSRRKQKNHSNTLPIITYSKPLKWIEYEIIINV
jgi:hypothetical protein